MGPFVHMGFASEGERGSGCDEAGASRAAFELAARDLAALSARARAGVGECLGFQLALLEDDAPARGWSVSLCGDVAADPAQTLELSNCGLREFSMSANALSAVKRVLLETSETRLV